MEYASSPLYNILSQFVDYTEFSGVSTSKKELVSMIENYIRYYNNRRVQRGLGILTPMEKHYLYQAA